jgi:soluble lytic murein transglycosylase
MARTLHDKGSSSAHDKLSAFAKKSSSGLLGRRAALALGYFDYTKGRYPQALRWLHQGEGDPILREYALFWGAQAQRASGQNAAALIQLILLHRDFPQSVMNDQILQALGETALALQKPDQGLVALDADDSLATKPTLLFVRAELREQAGRLDAAAADYLAVYYHLPLSTQADEAGIKAELLARKLGGKFPAVSLAEKTARAAALYDARSWRDAREEYAKHIDQLAGAERERALLRVAQCRVALGAGPDAFTGLSFTDPDVDAERLYSLSQVYRSQKREPEMLAAIEQTVSRSPQGRWAEQALFAAGNYYWVQLDLDRAGQYYRRAVEGIPNGSLAPIAQWRLVWQAYRERRPQAATLLEEYVGRYPGSSFLPDALYWLGRIAERAGTLPLARAYFTKLSGRFPQNYFGARAVERLRVIGTGPSENVALLAQIPPVPVAPKLDEEVPPAAAAHRDRAEALHSIALDASAELEFRAAYAATGAPSLLLEASQEALEAKRYGVAFVTVRQIIQQLESRPFEGVPQAVWRVAYPLPYRQDLERAAARASVDPMQIAGLIRQESAFQPDAYSHAGAIGLMQLIPPTAQKLARQLRIRYSRARLFEPEYNLRLGTVYFANLRKSYGSVEAALAAYNAGEDRVASWEAGRTYDEPAEFVESIPFTETREYVQVVMRNGAIYRAVYSQPAAGGAAKGEK